MMSPIRHPTSGVVLLLPLLLLLRGRMVTGQDHKSSGSSRSSSALTPLNNMDAAVWGTCDEARNNSDQGRWIGTPDLHVPVREAPHPEHPVTSQNTSEHRGKS